MVEPVYRFMENRRPASTPDFNEAIEDLSEWFRSQALARCMLGHSGGIDNAIRPQALFGVRSSGNG